MLTQRDQNSLSMFDKASGVWLVGVLELLYADPLAGRQVGLLGINELRGGWCSRAQLLQKMYRPIHKGQYISTIEIPDRLVILMNYVNELFRLGLIEKKVNPSRIDSYMYRISDLGREFFESIRDQS